MKYKNYFLLSFLIIFFLPLSVYADTTIPTKTITSVETWTASSSPYIVTGDVTIASGGTLNIEAGAVVIFYGSRKVNVLGTLNVTGVLGNLVSVNTIEDNGNPVGPSGRWGGFVFQSGSVGNINYLTEKYAGIAIKNLGGGVSINNSVFNNDLLTFDLHVGTTTIENSNIDTNQSALLLYAGELTLNNNNFSNSTIYAVTTYGSATVSADGNTFTNTHHGAFTDINNTFTLGTNIFSGTNDYSVWAVGGSVTADKTLVSSTYNLATLWVDPGAKLTIEAGAKFNFLDTSSTIIQQGELVINGTKENPVIMNSYSGNFLNIRGIDVEDTGSSTINYLQISNLNYGIYVNTNSTTQKQYIENSTFKDSMVGIGLRAGSVTVHNSRFINNLSYSARNDISANFDATNNWWGSEDGPYSADNPDGNPGSAVSPHVDVSPWLTLDPREIGISKPVIIIPGIMGSAYKNGVLKIDPILHTYDDLIATLIANGYVEGQTLFTFPYEWRDSNVLTADLLDAKIEAVTDICLALSLPNVGCAKVDLVAHSMGGLVAREYIQSTYYNNDVNKIIFLATPHKGSPKSYLQWEAGQFRPDLSSQMQKIFFSAEALRYGYLTIHGYVHGRPILSLRELLPTFDYLEDLDAGVLRSYPTGYPRNSFLESLNNNISNLLNSGVKIYNLVGNSGIDTVEKIRVKDSTHSGLWADGEPEGFYAGIGDHGLENGSGDRTVTLVGSDLDDSITNEEFNSTHNRLVTDAEARVYQILTGETAAKTFDGGSGLDPKVLLIQLFSPINVEVIAPDGSKVGTDFDTGGEYSEISDAFYSGANNNHNEYITILNPQDGEYKVNIKGTGNGEYTILTSLIGDELLSQSSQTSTITSGENKTLILDKDSDEVQLDFQTSSAPNSSGGGSSFSSGRRKATTTPEVVLDTTVNNNSYDISYNPKKEIPKEATTTDRAKASGEESNVNSTSQTKGLDQTASVANSAFSGNWKMLTGVGVGLIVIIGLIFAMF